MRTNSFRLLVYALIGTVLSWLVILSVARRSPNSSALDIPKPSLDICRTNSDCTLAIRVDVCCSCPEITTLKRVQNTAGVELYIPGQNYSSYLPAKCSQVDCLPCSVLPAGILCQDNVCQAPNTLQEILETCPECYFQAAQAVYQEEDLEQATNFCTQLSKEQQANCFYQLFDSAIKSKQLSNAEQICRERLNQDIGRCLHIIALEWANENFQRALALCNDLERSDAQHFACILDVALEVRIQNLDQALVICSLLTSDEYQLCRSEVLK